MKTIVTKWGNSLALRLPKPFADQLKLIDKSEVEVMLEKDRIVIKRSQPSLEKMLKKVDHENLHTETDTGPITGKEIW